MRESAKIAVELTRCCFTTLDWWYGTQPTIFLETKMSNDNRLAKVITEINFLAS